MSKAEPEGGPLDEVDPLLADYACALQEIDTPTVDRAEATWAAVEARTRQPSRLWIGAVFAAAAVLIGIMLIRPWSITEGGQTGRAQQTQYSNDAPATDGQTATKALPAAPKPPPTKASEPTPAPEPEPEPKPRSQAETRRARPENTAADPGPSSLAQETSLLREIQRAQAADEHRRVLELTRAHRRRFPKGTFAGERTLARVRAQCQLGRTQDARKTSQEFIRKHPQSHLVSQFESACGESR